MAQALTFDPVLQEALEAGSISPQQAWLLEQEFARMDLPFSPPGLQANWRLQLHWMDVSQSRPS